MRKKFEYKGYSDTTRTQADDGLNQLYSNVRQIRDQGQETLDNIPKGKSREHKCVILR